MIFNGFGKVETLARDEEEEEEGDFSVCVCWKNSSYTRRTRRFFFFFFSASAADGLTTSCAAANMDDLRVDTLFSSMDKKKTPNENIPQALTIKTTLAVLFVVVISTSSSPIVSNRAKSFLG